MELVRDEPPVWLLDRRPVFPDPLLAGYDDLVAVGGDFSPERLIAAYRAGIFPWFMDQGLIYWFSPDPRMIIEPSKIKVSKSLSKTLKRNTFDIRYDTAFARVMQSCATVRRKGEKEGSWITPEFIAGYTKLHKMGVAHSVEAWQDGELVGGLYGLKMGKVFCGESMFAKVPDASKAALVTLARKLEEEGAHMIDCQVSSPHLERMGGVEIDRGEYLERLKKALLSV